MWEYGEVTFGITELITGGGEAAAAFNYFFTVVWVFGLVAVTVAMLIRVVTRS